MRNVSCSPPGILSCGGRRIIDEIKIEILAIEAFHKQIEWLHAPHGAGLTFEEKYIKLFSEYVKGIDPEMGIIELTGPYSVKNNITTCEF